MHNGLIFHWKLGNFFLQEYALYANIISISEKVKHLYREKEKYDLEMFVHAHWDIFFSGIWGNVDRAFSPNHWKMYQLYQEHFKIYSFNQLIVGKYNTPLFSSIYGENNVCSALVVAKCMYFRHPKFSNVVGWLVSIRIQVWPC